MGHIIKPSIARIQQMDSASQNREKEKKYKALAAFFSFFLSAILVAKHLNLCFVLLKGVLIIGEWLFHFAHPHEKKQESTGKQQQQPASDYVLLLSSQLYSPS